MRLPFNGSFRLTQGFGENPASYKQFNIKGHNGQDYGLPVGTPVVAPHGGKVIESGFLSALGNYVKLESGSEGSVLCHLSRRDVGVGTQVSEGQQVGLSGATGNVTGPHLHWGYYRLPRNRANGFDGFIDQAPYITVVKPAAPATATVASGANRPAYSARTMARRTVKITGAAGAQLRTGAGTGYEAAKVNNPASGILATGTTVDVDAWAEGQDINGSTGRRTNRWLRTAVSKVWFTAALCDIDLTVLVDAPTAPAPAAPVAAAVVPSPAVQTPVTPVAPAVTAPEVKIEEGGKGSGPAVAEEPSQATLTVADQLKAMAEVKNALEQELVVERAAKAELEAKLSNYRDNAAGIVVARDELIRQKDERITALEAEIGILKTDAASRPSNLITDLKAALPRVKPDRASMVTARVTYAINIVTGDRLENVEAGLTFERAGVFTYDGVEYAQSVKSAAAGLLIGVPNADLVLDTESVPALPAGTITPAAAVFAWLATQAGAIKQLDDTIVSRLLALVPFKNNRKDNDNGSPEQPHRTI